MHWTDGQEEKLHIRGSFEIDPWDVNIRPGLPNAKVAWRGLSPAGVPVFLYCTTWTNSRPDVLLATIDLESTATVGAPLIVAITAE